MKPVFLTGFMGTGKTTVGTMLAERLVWEFVDLDSYIVEVAGASIPEIFSEQGEGCFRDLETAALRRFTNTDKVVVSTGGGAVIRQDNRSYIHEIGYLVNLTASHDSIMSRLEGDATRPLLAEADRSGRIAELIAEREQFYMQSDVRIDTTGKAPAEIVDEILVWLKTRG
jgi:shikimate kinase